MEATKARREAAILVFVVFLLGVLLGGVGNHLWSSRVWGNQGAQAGPAMPTRDQFLTDFTRDLELTPDQEKQLGSILDDTRSKFHALDTSTDTQRGQIREESRAKMRGILTPEQQPKFEAFMQQYDAKRKSAKGH